MPEIEMFACTNCGSTQFYTHINETIVVYLNGAGDIDEYGDTVYSEAAWNYPYYCEECNTEFSSLLPGTPEEEWIETKKRSYLNGHAANCPICNSNAVEVLSLNSDVTIAWQTCSCGECGAEWNDVYRLRGIEIISYPKDKVPPELIELPTPEPGIPNPNEAFLNENN